VCSFILCSDVRLYKVREQSFGQLHSSLFFKVKRQGFRVCTGSYKVHLNCTPWGLITTVVSTFRGQQVHQKTARPVQHRQQWAVGLPVPSALRRSSGRLFLPTFTLTFWWLLKNRFRFLPIPKCSRLYTHDLRVNFLYVAQEELFTEI